MPCAEVLYCVMRWADGMSCVEVASTASVGDPPSALSRSKHGPPGVSLLAIGCEAVVKKSWIHHSRKAVPALSRARWSATPITPTEKSISIQIVIFCLMRAGAGCEWLCVMDIAFAAFSSSLKAAPSGNASGNASGQACSGITSSERRPTSVLRLSRLRQTPTIWRTARPDARCSAVPKAVWRRVRQGWCRS